MALEGADTVRELGLGHATWPLADAAERRSLSSRPSGAGAKICQRPRQRRSVGTDAPTAVFVGPTRTQARSDSAAPTPPDCAAGTPQNTRLKGAFE